jgi:hypothetical protein
VLAVSGKANLRLEYRQRQVKTILTGLPATGWMRLSVGKAPRALADMIQWLPLDDRMKPTYRCCLLVRRSVSDPTDLAASLVYAPQAPTLEAVTRVSGTRWTIESCFEAAKGGAGLDHS